MKLGKCRHTQTCIYRTFPFFRLISGLGSHFPKNQGKTSGFQLIHLIQYNISQLMLHISALLETGSTTNFQVFCLTDYSYIWKFFSIFLSKLPDYDNPYTVNFISVKQKAQSVLLKHSGSTDLCVNSTDLCVNVF